MNKSYFITGVTGLVGSFLLKELMESEYVDESKIYVLIRARDKREARKRLLNVFQKMSNKNVLNKLGSLNILLGDVSQKNLGLGADVLRNLYKNIDYIYHSAALCDFNVPWHIIKNTNVIGTQNILYFAKSVQRNNQNFKKVFYISTVAVAGNFSGLYKENYLDKKQLFNNTYEKSKFYAERLCWKFRKSDLDISIFRPAIVIGNSESGYTNNFKMIYQPIHFFSLGLFSELPGNLKTKYSFCPVDYVAKAIVLLSHDKACSNATFHVSNNYYINLKDFLNLSKKIIGIDIPRFTNNYNHTKLSFVKKAIVEPYIPYFNYRAIFDSSKSLNILKKYGFKWPRINEKLLRKIYDYCISSSFIRKK